MSAVPAVQISSDAIAQLMAMAVAAAMEQATEMVQLNLQMAISPTAVNPPGVGGSIDVQA